MKKTLIQKILEGILSFFTWTNYNMMKKSDLYLYYTSLVTKIFWWLTVWDSLTHSSKIQLVIRILIFNNIIICSSAPPPPSPHFNYISSLFSFFCHKHKICNGWQSLRNQRVSCLLCNVVWINERDGS